MDKKELIKQLKQDYYNDFVVLLDSVTFGFKYWIYGDRETADNNYNRIKKNCDLLKPCTVEVIGLF